MFKLKSSFIIFFSSIIFSQHIFANLVEVSFDDIEVAFSRYNENNDETKVTLMITIGYFDKLEKVLTKYYYDNEIKKTILEIKAINKFNKDSLEKKTEYGELRKCEEFSIKLKGDCDIDEDLILKPYN